MFKRSLSLVMSGLLLHAMSFAAPVFADAFSDKEEQL